MRRFAQSPIWPAVPLGLIAFLIFPSTIAATALVLVLAAIVAQSPEQTERMAAWLSVAFASCAGAATISEEPITAAWTLQFPDRPIANGFAAAAAFAIAVTVVFGIVTVRASTPSKHAVPRFVAPTRQPIGSAIVVFGLSVAVAIATNATVGSSVAARAMALSSGSAPTAGPGKGLAQLMVVTGLGPSAFAVVITAAVGLAGWWLGCRLGRWEGVGCACAVLALAVAVPTDIELVLLLCLAVHQLLRPPLRPGPITAAVGLAMVAAWLHPVGAVGVALVAGVTVWMLTRHHSVVGPVGAHH